MNKDDFWHWLFSDVGAGAVAGALGGIVRWLTLRESWREGAISIIVGSICAMYVGPLVAPLLEPTIGRIAPGGDAAGFSAFLVGLGGISIASLVIETFSARRKALRGDDETPPQK